jgi:outer membrane protein assembly factor BamB
MLKFLISFFFVISSGLLTAQPPTKTGNETSLSVRDQLWTFKTGGKIFSSPYIYKSVAFIGSEDQHLYAIDTRSGKLKWKFKTEGTVYSTATASNELVYFGSFDGHYYAVDIKTGEMRWSFRTGGEKWMGGKGYFGMKPDTLQIDDPWEFFLSSPVLATVGNSSVLVFGSSDNNVYAVDALTGSLKWKFTTAGIVHSSPAIFNNTVYIGSWDTFLYAIDLSSGALKWKFKTGSDMGMTGIQASPVVDHGLVYFGARDANFYALDANTGEVRWKYFADNSWVLSNAVSKNNTIYFGTSDSFLVIALDATTGEAKWKTKLHGYVYSTPFIDKAHLFVGDFTGELYMVNAGDGKIESSFLTASKKMDGPQKLNKGDLDFAKLAEGKDMAQYTTTKFVMDELYNLGAIVSSPVVENDMLYFGAADGNLYAIKITAK